MQQKEQTGRRRRFEQCVSVVGRIGALLLLPLIAVIIFDVTTRRLPGVGPWFAATPIGPYITSIRLQELEWHLHGIVIFTAIGFALLRDTHVRIDILRQKLGMRGRVWVEIAGIVLLLVPFVCVLLYFGWSFVVRAWVSGEASPSMAGLSHRWIIKSFLLLGMGMLLIAAVAILGRMLAFLRSATMADALDRRIIGAEDNSENRIEDSSV